MKIDLGLQRLDDVVHRGVVIPPGLVDKPEFLRQALPVHLFVVQPHELLGVFAALDHGIQIIDVGCGKALRVVVCTTLGIGLLVLSEHLFDPGIVVVQHHHFIEDLDLRVRRKKHIPRRLSDGACRFDHQAPGAQCVAECAPDISLCLIHDHIDGAVHGKDHVQYPVVHGSCAYIRGQVQRVPELLVVRLLRHVGEHFRALRAGLVQRPRLRALVDGILHILAVGEKARHLPRRAKYLLQFVQLADALIDRRLVLRRHIQKTGVQYPAVLRQAHRLLDQAHDLLVQRGLRRLGELVERRGHLALADILDQYVVNHRGIEGVEHQVAALKGCQLPSCEVRHVERAVHPFLHKFHIGLVVAFGHVEFV